MFDREYAKRNENKVFSEELKAVAGGAKAVGVYCAFTPGELIAANNRRFELIGDIIEGYHIDGVVELTWQACHTYNVEAFLVSNFVKENYGKPYIQIETTYSESDVGQIRVRIEAFLELLQSRIA